MMVDINSLKTEEGTFLEIDGIEWSPVRNVINKLRTAIDISCVESQNAKDLVLETAREMDERGLCKREDVSRKIKQLLGDKIAEGKISVRWIEECLPKEYKRSYRKSEVSSLSEDTTSNDDLEVQLQNDGTVLMSKDGIREATNEPTCNGLEEECHSGVPLSGRDINEEKLVTMLVQTSQYEQLHKILKQSKRLHLIWLSPDQIFLHVNSGIVS
jgi:hypothetical protein